MHIVELLLIILGLIVFGFAIIWEVHDGYKFTSQGKVYDIEDPIEQERACEFYGCFASNERVIWRPIYIATFIASAILIYIFHLMHIPPTFSIYIVLFAAIFGTFYAIESFKNYHMYSLLCQNSQFHKPFFISA